MSSRRPTIQQHPIPASAPRPFGFDIGFHLSLVLDPDGTIRGVTESNGIETADSAAFIGQNITTIAAQRDGGNARAAAWRERLALVRDATTAVNYADPGGAPDATPTVDCTVTPVRSSDGALHAILVDVDDRTEELNTQRRLVESEAQLRGALALTGVGRYVVDLEQTKLVGDARVAEIIGVDPDELMDGNAGAEGLFALVHEADIDRVRSIFEEATTGGPDFDAEYRINRPTEDGTEERWVAVLGRVDFDGRRPVRIVGVIEDTTDRRHEEEARLRMQKREAIGTLAGGIAHDFNNVIGAILSNASLAQREIEAGHSPATSVTEIARGAVRAADLVRRILDYSREDEPRMAPVDVAAVVREVCSLLRPTRPVGTDLTIRIEPGLPSVLCDASQLHQVVMNLVTNARSAIDRDGGVIDIAVDHVFLSATLAEGALPGGGYVAVTVRDNGTGMTEAVMRRAFDPFFTTKSAGEGTGLGLAAAQTIVRTFGGRIEVKSVLGQGSTFTVLLPVTTDRAAAPEPAAPLQAAVPPVTARVLFVDDETAFTRLAERAMPAYGCEPAAFTEPRAALDAFVQDPHGFDALVTDLSMPGMSGFELIGQVRALRPNLPVVLTSGFLSNAHRDEATRLQVDEIIPKPCSVDDLVAAVLALVETPASEAV